MMFDAASLIILMLMLLLRCFQLPDRLLLLPLMIFDGRYCFCYG